MLGQAQNKRRHEQALNVRILVGHIQCVLVAGAVVAANGGAGLHGVGCQAVVNQVELGDVCSTSKSSIDCSLVANGPVVAMVVGCFGMQSSCGLGLTHIDHRWQHVVFHFDQLGCIFGLLQSFGHHHGHVVAHVTHLAVGKDGVRRLVHRLAAGVCNQPAAGQAIDLGVDHIGAVQHGHHTRRSQGSSLVDALDVGVGMRRAHEHGVRHVV